MLKITAGVVGVVILGVDSGSGGGQLGRHLEVKLSWWVVVGYIVSFVVLCDV